MAADHRTKWWLNIAIAAAAAWICGLASLFTIALLERNAVAAEFDSRSLSEPDLFIALEAYKISETQRSTGRAFTSATERSSYDDRQRFHVRPAGSRGATRKQGNRS